MHVFYTHTHTRQWNGIVDQNPAGPVRAVVDDLARRDLLVCDILFRALVCVCGA